MKKLFAAGIILAGTTLAVVFSVLGPGGGAATDTMALSITNKLPGQEGFGLIGEVSYTIVDKYGKLKATGIAHNATIANGINEIADRLFDEGTVLNGANDAYRAIYATETASTEVQLEAGTFQTATSNLDANPKNDTDVDNTTGTEGEAIVSVQFTAGVGGSTIGQIILVKKANGATPVADDVLAFQNVTITLADSDTVTFTWTVTAS